MPKAFHGLPKTLERAVWGLLSIAEAGVVGGYAGGVKKPNKINGVSVYSLYAYTA